MENVKNRGRYHMKERGRCKENRRGVMHTGSGVIPTLGKKKVWAQVREWVTKWVGMMGSVRKSGMSWVETRKK